jgi:hypothetical protein
MSLLSCAQHCLYNLPRQRLHELLDIPPAADGASYYSFSPHPGWLFVVLDAYDISLLGWPDSHPRHLLAEAILDRENPNKVRGSALVCEVLSCSEWAGQARHWLCWRQLLHVEWLVLACFESWRTRPHVRMLPSVNSRCTEANLSCPAMLRLLLPACLLLHAAACLLLPCAGEEPAGRDDRRAEALCQVWRRRQ